ncbi:hypothetical protein BDN67DRAFT_992680 [Paxillus ammoniavirescens]|nr:hypothetical protein BDN67DRAFT_992680 [Paxillus ammoniavirescens]
MASSLLTTQDPLVHHGRHFGVQTLLTNGIVLMSEEPYLHKHFIKRKEYAIFKELLRMVPGLEACLMTSSEEEIMLVSELVQKGVNGVRADNTKGFNHECTGALLCPAGLDWDNNKTRMQLLIFLYENYTYNAKDPWNGLLRSGLLISAFKHIFTSPSSVDQESKATCSGNAHIHSMRAVTKASIRYVAMQTCFALTSAQVFSRMDLITDSEHFYCSIVELLEDPEEKDEVDQLLMWWNR